MKFIATAVLVLFINCCNNSYALQLKGLQVTRVSDGNIVNLEQTIQTKNQKTLLVVGTYAADFNAIEYGQRLKYYLPQLKEKGVSNFIMIMNSSPSAATAFAKILNLQSEIELYSDQTGSVGKQLKVCRGYNPDDTEMNPYVKLFVMLFGLGAWATLPSVIGGYIGNPFSKQPWIEASLAEGQLAGRWPNNAIEIEENTTTSSNNSNNNSSSNNAIKPTIDNYKIKSNKFAELPYVGGWGRRPLELATLRLQNMIGISLNHWNVLKPNEDELKAGVLTQLGACYVLESTSASNSGGDNISVKYEWKDEGICHVANFEDILKVL